MFTYPSSPLRTEYVSGPAFLAARGLFTEYWLVPTVTVAGAIHRLTCNTRLRSSAPILFVVQNDKSWKIDVKNGGKTHQTKEEGKKN